MHYPQEIYLTDRFILHPDAGTMDVAYRGHLILIGATAGIQYRTTDGNCKQLRLTDQPCHYRVAQEEASLTISNEDVTLSWYIGLGPSTRLWLRVTNRGDRPIYLEDMCILCVNGDGIKLGGTTASWRLYQNGWQSWSPTFTRPCVLPTAQEPPSEDYLKKHLPHGYSNDSLISDTFTVIKGQELSLVAGFVTTAQNVSAVRLTLTGDKVQQMAATCSWDGAALQTGERVISETLLIDFSHDPFALLEGYMDSLAQAMQARVPDHVPTGWCSWYYYYGENTEDDVLANVAAIREKGLLLEYILIDDGYQAAIGDWMSTNHRFPHGLPWVAQQIRKAGFQPGLWVAPFGVAQNSRLYVEHPDWVLTNPDGSPVVAWRHLGVEAPILALDCTHPGVQDWLATLFSTMAEEWGIELFKIDFCFAAALPGCHYDSAATRAMALRRGLEVIRQAIGERFLLGCGLPFGQAVGIVDGMRIGTDMAITWHPLRPDPAAPSTKNALLNVIARYACHGRLWLNDPDCLIIRERADENNLTYREVMTEAVVIGMSGGILMSGDDIATLSPARLQLLQRLLPPSNRAAVPLDLFEKDQPELLALSCEDPTGPYTLLAVINWDKEAKETVLDLPTLTPEADRQGIYVYDQLQQRRLGITQGIHHFGYHGGHTTLFFLLKPAKDHPTFITSSFHLLGGMIGVEEVTWTGSRLRIVLERPSRQTGQIVVSVPQNYDFPLLYINGRRRPLKSSLMVGDMLAFGVTIQGHTVLELDFRQAS